MPFHLTPNASSVGLEDYFSGNFTQAKFLRGHDGSELENRIGYGSGGLASGYWLLFALEKPDASNFEFGGYTHFSGSRIGDPLLGTQRPTVESRLSSDLGGSSAVLKRKEMHIKGIQLFGPDRLAKIIPVERVHEYPAGSGIYQCNVPRPIRCKVAAFVAPGEIYRGDYT